MGSHTRPGLRSHSSGTAGRITAIVDPDGNRIRYAYDAAGNLVAVTDQLGNTIRLAYRTDRPHYLDEITDPLGRRAAKTEYDASGRIIAVTDGNGNRTEQSFDPATFTETVKDGRGNPTVITYDARGNVVRTLQPTASGDIITQTFYDDPANPDKSTRVIDPNGGTTTTTYDARGNVTSVTDAAGNMTRKSYDEANHVTSVTDPLGHTTALLYDAAGNLIRLTDGSGAGQTATHDAGGRLKSVTDANGATTRYEYDDARPGDTPRLIIDPDGGTREFETNAFGEVTRAIDQNGNETDYTYGPTGLLLSSRDANGSRRPRSATTPSATAPR